MSEPYGVAVDRWGKVYVTDGTGRIQRFSNDGVYEAETEAHIATGPLATYENICYSKYGQTIKKFSSATLTKLAEWGSSGTGPGQFSDPMGIGVSPDGNIVYVADSGNNRIQKFVY